MDHNHTSILDIRSPLVLLFPSTLVQYLLLGNNELSAEGSGIQGKMFTQKRKLVLLMATMMLIGTLTIHALTSRTSNYSNSRDSSYFDYDSIFKELRSKPEGNHGFSMMNTSSNPLDGCYHVYLDVGTNVGIQVNGFL